ncbi:MAG: GIY-YIG nuclease family protein [Nitrososphaerales archaeon]
MAKRHFVYILNCGGGYLYTGYTIDLARRIYEHSQGAGGKFTRSHLPVSLVYSEVLETRSQALKREISIKRLPRLKKLNLIKSQKVT